MSAIVAPTTRLDGKVALITGGSSGELLARGGDAPFRWSAGAQLNEEGAKDTAEQSLIAPAAR